MMWRSSIVLCLVAAVFIVAAKGEPPRSAGARTNTPAPNVGKTYIIDVVEGKRTNITLQVRWSDGTLTNIVLRPDSKLARDLQLQINDLRNQRSSPRLGDYWLPGEFEKLLKERKQQRREKAQ